jgi:hypothetical protein
MDWTTAATLKVPYHCSPKIPSGSFGLKIFVEQELTEGTEGFDGSTELAEGSAERFSVISVCSC